MSKIRSVKFNFVMNVILTLSTMIFPLITFPYASNVLLPEGVGEVSAAYSLAQVFAMVAMLGVPIYGIRVCAQVRDDKEALTRTVQELLILNLIVSIFVYVVYFLAIWQVQKMHAEAALYVVMSTTIILNVVGVEWLYKALEQYAYIALRSVIFKAAALVLMFLFVRDENDVVIYGAITVLAGVGSYIMNFINLRKYVGFRPVGSYNFKRHIVAIAIFFMMSVATTIYTNLDSVMLKFMQNNTEVGYYTAAVKVKGILVSFVTALSAVLLPRVSYYIEKGRTEEFRLIGRKAMNFVVLISLPVVVYFILYAPESIYFISSEMYEPAIIPMQIIMPTVLLIGLTNVLGIQILVPLGREKEVCISVIVGAVVDFVINLITIPTMSSAGAALGTLAAEFAVLVVQVWCLRDRIKDLAGDIHGVRAVIAVAVASVACYPVKLLELRDILALIVSVIIFIAVYCVTLLIMREPLSREIIGGTLRKVLRK